MNILIDIQDLKTRMALIDAPAGNPMIESAVIAAQIRLEAELDTRFDLQEDQADTFLLDASMTGSIIPYGMFRLRLKNGFVLGTPVVAVSDSRLFTSSETLETTEYELDLVRGYVFVAEDYADRYIRVTYSSGFNAYGPNVTPVVPGWLNEAILGYTPVVFNFGQTTARKDEAEKNYRMSGDHALACAAPYRRQLGFALSPIA